MQTKETPQPSNKNSRLKQTWMKDSEFNRSIDGVALVLIGTFLTIVIMGLINLYSASLGGSFFYGQLRSLAIGLVLFGLTGWIIPLRVLNTYCYWIYGLVCILLVAVLFSGHISNGSQRWLIMGPFTFQPSELAKLSAAILVAHYFHYNPLGSAYRLSDFRRIGLLVGALFALIFEQPDLGTAGIVVLVAAFQIVFLRIDRKAIFLVTLGGLALSIFAWFLLLHDYQRTRVLTLLDPTGDPFGKGYNSLQSLVAIGSGNLFGKGFMDGTQTQLQFLPARQTDFIFSVFAEEHGFMTSALLFILFGVMTYSALLIAKGARDTFSSMLAIGIAALIFIQFAINVAMVLGLFPIVGIPLPFFSHGGSSLMTICAGVGILIAINRARINKHRPLSHSSITSTGAS